MGKVLYRFRSSGIRRSQPRSTKSDAHSPEVRNQTLTAQKYEVRRSQPRSTKSTTTTNTPVRKTQNSQGNYTSHCCCRHLLSECHTTQRRTCPVPTGAALCPDSTNYDCPQWCLDVRDQTITNSGITKIEIHFQCQKPSWLQERTQHQ
jgi:hypothetical protein